MIADAFEVAHARLGPDRIWRSPWGDISSDLAVVSYVRHAADPCPMPRVRLFRWLPR